MPDINKAFTWAVQTCNAANIGYSQDYRNQQAIGGITYYDCSSFINYALVAGGFSTPQYAPSHNAFTTYDMIGVLLSLGFVEVDAKGEYLAGDVGWKTGHTEMCYRGGLGQGVFMGAHTANAPLAYQVSIGNSSGDPDATRSFTRLFRYGEGGAGGYGASLYVVSAICGNLWQESNINPGLWEGRRVGTFDELKHGYGLGQWTNTGGDTHGRLWQMADWMTSNGYPTDDGNGQLQYIIVEDTWYPTQEASAFANLTEFLNSPSTDLTMLTHAWNIGWEGIHDASWDLRVEHAFNLIGYIQTHANDASINTWVAKNDYLTQDEIYNNAVLVYRYLSAGGGGGGTPSKDKKKMPVWMWIKYW